MPLMSHIVVVALLATLFGGGHILEDQQDQQELRGLIF
jgi:hypothetical protein